MRKIKNGTGFLIHGIQGKFKGKVSAWFDADGKVEAAEQILNNFQVRSVKKDGPMWINLASVGQAWKGERQC